MIRDAVTRKLFGEKVKNDSRGKVYNDVISVNFFPQKRKADVYYGFIAASQKITFSNLSEVQFGSPVNIFWEGGSKGRSLIDANYMGLKVDAWIEQEPDSRLRILMISN